MTHASLFSGIGGFDLAARNCGIRNIFQVEINEFCQQVLEKNFPETIKYRDIKQFDGTEYYETIDIISGGFPCQPFSVAGKRKGSEDDRFLWAEMLRVITEVGPSWVIAENVPGILTIEGGMVFEQCVADLENAGYEVQTVNIPAIAVNAPHRRERIWIIAHSDVYGNRGRQRADSEEDGISEFNRQTECSRRILGREVERCSRESSEYIADSAITRLQRQVQLQNSTGNVEQNSITNSDSSGLQTTRSEFATAGTAGDDTQNGIGWDTHWFEVATELCRVDDGLPNRVDRIKALGNAIVPQVAELIFKAILNLECEL